MNAAKLTQRIDAGDYMEVSHTDNPTGKNQAKSHRNVKTYTANSHRTRRTKTKRQKSWSYVVMRTGVGKNK